MRDSFSFSRIFKDAINDLPDADKLVMYEAITDYALDLKEPNLTGFQKIAFDLIRQKLDQSIKRWQNGCKGGMHGNKGGAPNGNKNASKKNNPKTTANQPQNNPKPEENSQIESGQNKSSKRFIKPTIQEIKDFLREKSISIDPERFYNYYESNGWKVGRNLMKDWRAAVRTWSNQATQTKSADIGIILKDNNPDKYKKGLW